MFTPVTVPYLRSEYGKEFEFDAPVKILDKLLHDMCALKRRLEKPSTHLYPFLTLAGLADLIRACYDLRHAVALKHPRA